MKFTEENFFRIMTNFGIVVTHKFYKTKEPFIIIPREEADKMLRCSEELVEMAYALEDEFAEQFHWNSRARKNCPNENCKTIYAYFYEDFIFCPKCGTKLTTGVKKHE